MARTQTRHDATQGLRRARVASTPSNQSACDKNPSPPPVVSVVADQLSKRDHVKEEDALALVPQATTCHMLSTPGWKIWAVMGSQVSQITGHLMLKQERNIPFFTPQWMNACPAFPSLSLWFFFVYRQCDMVAQGGGYYTRYVFTSTATKLQECTCNCSLYSFDVARSISLRFCQLLAALLLLIPICILTMVQGIAWRIHRIDKDNWSTKLLVINERLWKPPDKGK